MKTVSENDEQCSGNHEKKSVVQILLTLCEHIELFHSHDNEPYSTIMRNGHKENLALNSTDFKRWLLQEYYKIKKSAPPDKILQDAIKTLAAKALFEGEKKSVYLRIAHLDNRIYLDLTNDDWEVIEIGCNGWKLLKDSPVIFRRAKGMEALPTPEVNENAGVGINYLRYFLNIETESDFILLVSWLLSTLGTNGPFLVLVLYGEQGTAKSTSVKVLRNLADPNVSPLRRPPKNTDDLLVAARGNYIVAVDNMSHLPDWLSDDLCVLSTGGGLSKRKLYTDDEEIVLDAKRPIIANGIDEFVTRGDLASRSVFLSLPVIPKDKRKPEVDFWKQFLHYQPWILGALLSAVSEGLKNIPHIALSENERMADAWRFISAAETAFGWERGTGLQAFKENQEKANEVVLNSSILYPMISAYADQFNGFSGTAQHLLTKIRTEAIMFGISLSEIRFLPHNPKSLSDKLRRLAPALRFCGIDISFDKSSGTNSKRLVHIKRTRNFNDACDAGTVGDDSDAKSSLM